MPRRRRSSRSGRDGAQADTRPPGVGYRKGGKSLTFSKYLNSLSSKTTDEIGALAENGECRPANQTLTRFCFARFSRFFLRAFHRLCTR